MASARIITREYLKEWLKYDPSTGNFIWRKTKHYNSIKGSIAGCTTQGYVTIGLGGTNFLAHRLVWLYVYGEMPAAYIDHINNDGTDNRIANLRECTKSTNGMNRDKPCHNTSGYKGVSFRSDKNRYEAYITSNQIRNRLGYFSTAEEAASAYNSRAIDLHGEFAMLNYKGGIPL